MALFTEKQHLQLLHNGSALQAGKDHYPVVKLFFPDTAIIILLTELDPEAPEFGFGLFDLGYGYPELVPMGLTELNERGLELGKPLCADSNFLPSYPVSIYARAAVLTGHYSEDARLLEFLSKETTIVPSCHYKLTP